MISHGLRRAQVIELLSELERRLMQRGVALGIQVMGGAALLLHGLIDRATEDIDARYQSSDVVDDVAGEMAVEYGLPKQWLNSHAAAFLPDNVRWVPALIGASAAIKLADLPSLAAMKVAAEREKVIIDHGYIANALGIEDPDALVDLAYDKYGEESIPLSAGRANYEIVADEALAAARRLKLQ